ncbi:sulfur stress regulator [Raphidocelis subcapitata]|uniref:Sulfur stress regulator n=1 Tax=Raphidocelis subcapitata TaxID=307507 RepID=A0A2V0P0B9_9CHLO|nr:sulfur stress regulator [Raphidocelis subcapitata]|eukprot:GBF93316.1 sulfur stress regulator [Raphidocelis subcapitata]
MAEFTEMGVSKYVFVQEVGKGSFGCVVLAKNTETGELVAIKKMEREFLQARYVESEILNHSILRHPHVVQFREVFLSPRHINIVMDYASGGSLFTYVQQRQRLREPLARWFFQQLLLAVDYCHKKGVGIRDVKLENTLLQVIPGLPRPLLKICDFGYSKHDTRSCARSKVGTLLYMAPEVLHNSDGRYNAKMADVWSCGVMLVGRYPFQAPADADATVVGVASMLKAMRCRDYDLPEEALGLSPRCAALLRRLLEPDEGARIRLEEVLADPWFLTDLPPDALKMNDKYLASSRPCAQTDADIRAIVAAAAADADGR